MRNSALVLAVLSLALAGSAGEVPFGHADWRPSPTDPAGFAGQGSNWYPGATPPTQWWEGTPTIVEGKVGNRGIAFNYGEYPNTARLNAYADSKAKNVLWKAPVPGWSDSHPVVAGKRVISLASPHYVTCYDADTGKVLWQDELKLMLLPMLNADRKSIGPAPDPAKAAREQDLFERTVGYVRLRIGATGNARDRKEFKASDWAPRAGLIKYAVEVLEKWKSELKADWPDIGPTLDGEIACLRDCLAGKLPEERPVPEGARAYRVPFAGKAPPVISKAPDLQSYAMKALGLRFGGYFGNAWQGHISDTMATPVTDGQVVCVTFGHGQLAAYELATGKRLWAWRDPAMNAASASHLPSPLLWRDHMIFMAPGRDGLPGGKGASRTGTYFTTVMAVDKRSGAVKWEVPGGMGGWVWGSSHGAHMSPALLRLPDGKGGLRGIVISNKGGVVDAETGKELAQLPAYAGKELNTGTWQSGFVAAVNGRVYKGAAGDNYNPALCVWPVRLSGEKLEIDAGFMAEAKPGQSSFAVSDRVGVVGGATLIDPASGRKLAELAPPNRGTATLAGNLLIVARDDVGGDGQRARQDRMMIASFDVFDVSDPAKPRLLAKNNLLGDATTPADIADKHFPEFAKPDYKIFALGCYRGIASVFGVRTAGVTAHGSRLYIKSNTHLYCVGER